MGAQFGIAEGYAWQVRKTKQFWKSSSRLKSYGIIFYFSFPYPFILTADLPYFNSFCSPKGLFIQRTLEKLTYYFWSLKSD